MCLGFCLFVVVGFFGGWGVSVFEGVSGRYTGLCLYPFMGGSWFGLAVRR